jgi:hypothetical protein
VPQLTAIDVRSAIDWAARLHESALFDLNDRNVHIGLMAHAKVHDAWLAWR